MDTNIYQGIFDRSCTDEYHPDVVPDWQSAAIIETAVRFGSMIDDLKRGFAYGARKANDEQRTIQMLTDQGYRIAPVGTEGRSINDLDPKLVHGILGVFSEAVELVQILLDYLRDGKEIDLINLKEELGDINWYQFLLLKHVLHLTIEQVLGTNIAKLSHRYPGKFTLAAANDRDLEGERAILES